jgi:tripeptide aminopeptidase
MVNALRAAGSLIDRLPRDLSPERTEGREGFVHPYQIEGGVARVVIGLLLRDFVTAKLTEQAELSRTIARSVEADHPGVRIDVDIRPQYRNMADGMKQEPRAVAYAIDAMKAAGLNPRIGSIRGGTDGAQLTAKGLPTPNLSTAEHHIHSPLEWTCLEEMQSAVRVLVELAKRWALPSASSGR